jgi:hypothetical protein
VEVGEPAMIVLEFCSNGSLYGYLMKQPELPKLVQLMQIAIDNVGAYRSDFHLSAATATATATATSLLLV